MTKNSDFRPIVPAVNQHVKLEKKQKKRRQKPLSIYIFPVSLYILFTSTAVKITVFRRCDALYFGK
jgi:hypothetical protein